MGDQSAVAVKRCGKCREWLSVEMFTVKRSNRDGLDNTCKFCRSHSIRIEWCDRLERPIRNAEDVTVADMLPYRRVERDKTLSKVYKALWYWVRHEVLSEAQAMALMAVAVDRLNWSEAARIIGVHHTTVRTNYYRGIRNLRRRYAIQVQTDVS